MDSFKKFFEEIKKTISKMKAGKSLLILLLGCFGILLIGFSELIPSEKEEISEFSEGESFRIREKEEEIEERIKNAVTKIKGAGKTEVTVMLESSGEYFYAENHSENSEENSFERESEYVIIDGEKGEKALLIKLKEAEIRGVLIVCEGGKNPIVAEKIIDAVRSLLNIPSNKVSVAEMA